MISIENITTFQAGETKTEFQLYPMFSAPFWIYCLQSFKNGRQSCGKTKTPAPA